MPAAHLRQTRPRHATVRVPVLGPASIKLSYFLGDGESFHPVRWDRRHARPSSTRLDGPYRPSYRRGACNSRTTARRGVPRYVRSGSGLRRRRWIVRGCGVLMESTLRRSESGRVQNRAQYVVGIGWKHRQDEAEPRQFKPMKASPQRSYFFSGSECFFWGVAAIQHQFSKNRR